MAIVTFHTVYNKENHQMIEYSHYSMLLLIYYYIEYYVFLVDTIISRKRAKMLNLNMCTNQWVETSIFIFATY